MSEFQASNFKKQNGGTSDLVGKTEFSSPYFFVPPSGDTKSRPESCAPGTLRFNTDYGSLEVYRGDTIGWMQIKRNDNQLNGGTRGLFMGGSSGPNSADDIDEITISTI